MLQVAAARAWCLADRSSEHVLIDECDKLLLICLLLSNLPRISCSVQHTLEFIRPHSWVLASRQHPAQDRQDVEEGQVMELLELLLISN